MRPKTRWPLLLLCAVVATLCLAGWTGRAQKDDAPKGRGAVWEYKTVRGDRALRDDQLNELGWHGWELVMFDDGERGNGSHGGTYYFKRAK
jgi:hypothetical protein